MKTAFGTNAKALPSNNDGEWKRHFLSASLQ